MKKNSAIVGHVPGTVSTLCKLFLRHHGSIISCRIAGGRRYSGDLPQCGMEIPCVLTFMVEQSSVEKVGRLMMNCNGIGSQESEHSINQTVDVLPPSSKKTKIDDDVCISSAGVWIRIDSVVLTMMEKEMVLQNMELDDMVINCAQKVLQNQFPLINGFFSTLSLQVMPSLTAG